MSTELRPAPHPTKPTACRSPRRRLSSAARATTRPAAPACIDTADDQVEKLFAPQYQTASSPAHRAVWDDGVPVELFQSAPPVTPPAVQQVMDDGDRGRAAGIATAGRSTTTSSKIADQVLADLGKVGYWGLLVDPQYGGSGRAVRCVRAVPHADGDHRSDRRRVGVGSWLHRRRRSGAHVRHATNNGSDSSWPRLGRAAERRSR